jgi:hypothetical protein
MPHALTASTPSNLAAVIQMAGTGLSQAKIAKALGISKKTVWTMLAQPDVATKVAQLRAALRVVLAEGIQAVAPPALDWAKRLAEEQKDPKAFDAVMRGLHAGEKIAASASGENRPQAQPAQQVQVLVAPGWVKGPWQAQAKVVDAASTPALPVKPSHISLPPDDL